MSRCSCYLFGWYRTMFFSTTSNLQPRMIPPKMPAAAAKGKLNIWAQNFPKILYPRTSFWEAQLQNLHSNHGFRWSSLLIWCFTHHCLQGSSQFCLNCLAKDYEAALRVALLIDVIFDAATLFDPTIYEQAHQPPIESHQSWWEHASGRPRTLRRKVARQHRDRPSVVGIFVSLVTCVPRFFPCSRPHCFCTIGWWWTNNA